MIPILFEYDEVNFNSHGLCSLPDCISATAVEKRNGYQEFTIEYPCYGENFNEIQIGRIIGAYTNDRKSVQGFRIFSIEKSLNGIVVVYARHVSHDLSGYIAPVIDGEYSPMMLMNLLFDGTNFTGYSDIDSIAHVKINTPVSVMSILGGMEGSLIDTFGGEYDFDNFTIKLLSSRGEDNGVTVEYGKNMTSLSDSYDTDDVYSGILPYAAYHDETGESVVVRGEVQECVSILPIQKIGIVDFSDRFDSESTPSIEELNAMAQEYILDKKVGTTQSNISVSFVPFWYENPEDRLSLCDTVTIRHEILDVNTKAKVVQTTYDCLIERFTKITCGKATQNIISTMIGIQDTSDYAVNTAKAIPSQMSQIVLNATELITGNKGGYVRLHEGVDGKPYEILILDNEDITLANNVWRWNNGGLGFSANGYNGPYTTALTNDGKINASMILAGIMSADFIQGGHLRLGTSSTSGGVLELYDGENTLIGLMDKDGLKMYGSDGSYVLMNNSVGFAGYDKNDNLVYWVNRDEFHMKKSVVEEEITLCGKMRFIPITIVNGGTVVNDGIGLVSVAR